MRPAYTYRDGDTFVAVYFSNGERMVERYDTARPTEPGRFTIWDRAGKVRYRGVCVSWSEACFHDDPAEELRMVRERNSANPGKYNPIAGEAH